MKIDMPVFYILILIENETGWRLFEEKFMQYQTIWKALQIIPYNEIEP